MTAATGFKRLGIAIAAVVLASFAALGAMALLIPVDTVRDATKAEIRNVTGLDLVLRGDVAVSLFPTGSISFANVTLGDDAKPGAGGRPADRAAAVLPAVRRPHRDRRRVAGASAHQRELRPRRPFELGGIDRRAGARARPEGQPAGQRHLVHRNPHQRRHHRGAATPTRGIDETLQRTSSWRWPGRRSRKSFAATGRFVWHDEPIDAAITLTDFAAALAGDRSGLKLRLTGAPLKFAFEGNWSTQPTLEDRRHARRRRALAARHAALGRPQAAVRAAASAASRSRPRPTSRAARSRCRRSTSSSTATSPRACWPSPPTAGRPCRARSPPTIST